MDDNTKVSVFPNPATDKAIVEWSNEIIVNRIIVSDANGKIVLSQKTTKIRFNCKHLIGRKEFTLLLLRENK